VRAHIAGIAALIPSGIDVYKTRAERPDYNPADWSAAWTSTQKAAWTLPDRYVVITAPTFMVRAIDITDARNEVSDYFQVTAVGLSDDQCRWVHEKVRAVLDPKGGGRPSVTGFLAWTRLSATGITAVDTDVDPQRVFAVDTYRYQATPNS
jgi:hypothetical protein